METRPGDKRLAMSYTDAELEAMMVDLESDLVKRKESAQDGSKIRRNICAFANDLPRNSKPGVLLIGVRDNGSCASSHASRGHGLQFVDGDDERFAVPRVSNWGGEQLADDQRWRYGVPPKRNANFAWVQHMVHHLAPNGVAGFVLANGSMSSQAGGEGEIRKNLIEANLVDCMIALPGQLFYSTQIPVCLWFLARDRANGAFRDRRGEVLFIDARNEGHMVDRTHRELSQEDIARIAGAYHAWRGKRAKPRYEDVPGFCKSATLDDIRAHKHILTPGRYVGMAPQPEDDEPFHEKMTRLVAEWREQRAEAKRLDAAIAKNLAALGFGPAASKG